MEMSMYRLGTEKNQRLRVTLFFESISNYKTAVQMHTESSVHCRVPHVMLYTLAPVQTRNALIMSKINEKRSNCFISLKFDSN